MTILTAIACKKNKLKLVNFFLIVLVFFSAFKHRYGQTCNHVAGLLFRVEYANKMGYTSCTSNKCEWVVPKERPLEPAMLQDMAFKRSKHGKTGMIYM